MVKTVRLQVDILKHQLEELKKMQILGGLRSIRELWDTAFTALKWLAKKKAQGFSIGCRSADGVFTELEMPFFNDYAAGVNRERANEETGGKEEIATDERKVAAYVAGSLPKNRTSTIGLARKKQTA